jgi:hypothetical protein
MAKTSRLLLVLVLLDSIVLATPARRLRQANTLNQALALPVIIALLVLWLLSLVTRVSLTTSLNKTVRKTVCLVLVVITVLLLVWVLLLASVRVDTIALLVLPSARLFHALKGITALTAPPLLLAALMVSIKTTRLNRFVRIVLLVTIATTTAPCLFSARLVIIAQPALVNLHSVSTVLILLLQDSRSLLNAWPVLVPNIAPLVLLLATALLVISVTLATGTRLLHSPSHPILSLQASVVLVLPVTTALKPLRFPSLVLLKLFVLLAALPICRNACLALTATNATQATLLLPSVLLAITALLLVATTLRPLVLWGLTLHLCLPSMLQRVWLVHLVTFATLLA